MTDKRATNNSSIVIVIFIVSLFAITSLIYFFTIRRGIGFTFDSYQYLAAAESFKNQGVLKTSEGSPFIHWPPLYPIILSYLLDDFKTNIIILNFICLTGTIVTMSILANKLFKHDVIKFLYVLTLVFGVPLYLISKFIWTEPLFLLLFSLQMLFLFKYNEKKKLIDLIILSSLGVIYCLQRKTGVFFIFGIALSLLSEMEKIKDYRTLLFFLLISSMFIVIWLSVTSFNFSIFSPSAHSLEISKVSLFFIKCLSHWIVPPFVPDFVKCLIIVVILGLIIYEFIIKQNDFVFKTFLICFLIYFLVMQLFPYSDYTETERYLSVVYPLFFILIFKVMDRLSTNMLKSSNGLLIIVISIWLVYVLTRTGTNILRWNDIVLFF